MIARFMISADYPLIENGRIDVAKEFLVQHLHRSLRIASRNHETDIEQRSALRNHTNVDALHGAKCARGHAGRMAQIITDNANDSLVLFDADLGKLSQSVANPVEPSSIVNGQRDADFGACQHVYGGFRPAASRE